MVAFWLGRYYMDGIPVKFIKLMRSMNQFRNLICGLIWILMIGTNGSTYFTVEHRQRLY